MTLPLIRKLLRDVRLPLLIVALLLAVYQCLWAKITQRVTGDLVPFFMGLAAAQKIAPDQVEELLFQGPGRLARTMMGGEKIKLERAMDVMSVGYVHPLIQAILCIWAVGRASGALAGEIDRGTMELLLAQPLPRHRVLLAHLAVDLITIPVLCLSLWAGTWVGTLLTGPIGVSKEALDKMPPAIRREAQAIDPRLLEVDPAAFGPALWQVGALVFAISGLTMWLSARGRFRWRVLGAAVLLTLVQFLVNLIGQLWDAVEPLRRLTVFYYYQPQQVILGQGGSVGATTGLAVLLAVGLAGYALALWTFCRRDLPAPL